MLKEQEGPPEKPKLITEEKQSARRSDVMSFIRIEEYYWKNEHALLSGPKERMKLESISASSRGKFHLPA